MEYLIRCNKQDACDRNGIADMVDDPIDELRKNDHDTGEHTDDRMNSVNEMVDSVKVCRSWIPCSGFGLFANRKILYGEVICTYFGTKYGTADALKLVDKSYLMRLGIQCYIDSNDHLNCLARYINDCRNALCYNVRFDKKMEDEIAQVIAIRDIEENEELYVDYGKWYWLSLEPSKLTFMDVQSNKLKLPIAVAIPTTTTT